MNISKIEDLKPGEGAVIDENGKRVAVYKKETGEIIKLESKCTHLGCEIGWDVTKKAWVCPCHGAEFDTNGAVLKGPAKEGLKQI